ncbi:hypothetical protein A0H76_3040 [Hepatospora eriocheir]|uniref:Uncharacterized protein n=1 Tax=Hepatospora eriocheir TaxID=1081669 RepID=A0A1X0QGJ3_9MICR|nr:hypothetical protein A0H76_3040 [Hepatospora eriocheir]
MSKSISFLLILCPLYSNSSQSFVMGVSKGTFLFPKDSITALKIDSLNFFGISLNISS